MENKEIRAHCGTWEPVPDSGNIDRVFVARPTIGNALKAMKDRHFKLGAGVGEMTELGKRHVQRAASVVKQHLLQNCVENGALAHAFDIMSVVPEEYKSGKWTEERFLTAMRLASVDVPRELKHELHVKPHEALSKAKARAIITSKDAGVVRHILDSRVLEHVLHQFTNSDQSNTPPGVSSAGGPENSSEITISLPVWTLEPSTAVARRA